MKIVAIKAKNLEIISADEGGRVLIWSKKVLNQKDQDQMKKEKGQNTNQVWALSGEILIQS